MAKKEKQTKDNTTVYVNALVSEDVKFELQGFSDKYDIWQNVFGEDWSCPNRAFSRLEDTYNKSTEKSEWCKFRIIRSTIRREIVSR